MQQNIYYLSCLPEIQIQNSLLNSEWYTSLIKLWDSIIYRLLPHISINKCILFTADIGATPFGLNSLGGLAGLESLGLGQSTFMDLQVSHKNFTLTCSSCWNCSFSSKCGIIDVKNVLVFSLIQT